MENDQKGWLIEKVLPCGTGVRLKLADRNGIITAVSIRDSGIMYEVSYFLDSGYQEGFFAEYEFVVQGFSDRIPIGYRGGNDDLL